jgi:serine/threonine-protein kinase
MPGSQRVLRRARGASSAIDFDTEEGRAFLQERLALFNKVSFLISGAFFLVGGTLGAIGLPPPEPLSSAFQHRSMTLHASTLVVELLAWLACARGPGLRPRTLRALDVGALFLVCAGFAAQAFDLAGGRFEPTGPYSRATLVLILTNVLLARAVFVPSPAPWTAALGACCAAPVVAVAVLSADAQAGAGSASIWLVLWALCAVVVATLASRVIYGLREQVQQARRLGQYTLEQKLGEGGMGVVYRASHAMLRRPTAIKLLPPEKAGGLAIERFEREVQLTARLSHPNTVAVFDYGRTPDGIFYYAMEYLDGVDLHTLVREDGSQPPGRVVHVLRQVAAALAEAHGIGLIHRDVKPENVHPLRTRRHPGRGEGRGLRARPRPRAGLDALARRRRSGHAALPLAGGDHGSRPRGGPQRPLRARRRGLLPADGTPRLRRRDARRGLRAPPAHAARPTVRTPGSAFAGAARGAGARVSREGAVAPSDERERAARPARGARP